MSLTVIKHIICELTGYRPGTVDVSQGDRGSRAVSCRLMENGAPWMIPEGATARVAYTLPDGAEGLYDRRPDGTPMWEISGNTVTAELADQLMAQAGMVQMSILVIGPEGGQLATWPIRVMVIADSPARLPVPEAMPPYGAGFAGKIFFGGPGGVVTPLELGLGLSIQDGVLYVANVPAALKALAGLKGSTGQIIEIGGVDAQGGVTELVAVDKPVGGDSGQNLELDSSLTKSGKAADAKATGDEIKRVERLIPSIEGLAKKADIPTKPEDIGARPNTWTPTAQEVGADTQGTAAGAVSAHNASDNAHNDIRQELAAINARLTAFFDSDNQTLDELSEIVAYITSNKSLIDAITTSKVSVADIVNNLTTNVANRPLSAAQGVAIKALIDGLDSGKLDASKLAEAINTALAQAQASGAFDGKDGVSATHSWNGTVLTITSASGTSSADLKGPKGDKGDKPAKGTDYYTQEDKTEMVNAVIAALPVYNGEVV